VDARLLADVGMALNSVENDFLCDNRQYLTVGKSRTEIAFNVSQIELEFKTVPKKSRQ
jgi:hypothetical protein